MFKAGIQLSASLLKKRRQNAWKFVNLFPLVQTFSVMVVGGGLLRGFIIDTLNMFI